MEIDRLLVQLTFGLRGAVALAQEIGSLSLVLRKPGQAQDMAMVPTVSLNDLRYGIYRGVPAQLATGAAPPQVQVTRVATPARPRARPAAPPQPKTKPIEVIRGTTGNEYQVGDYEG